MTQDFYCDEVLSGRTPVQKVIETDHILAFHHTRPFYPVHIVVIPKKHIDSFITLDLLDHALILELFGIIRQVAAQVTSEHGACRVVTNMGAYQDSKHLHFHVISGDPVRKTDI
jgi:histidine triad (HIT) family protein